MKIAQPSIEVWEAGTYPARVKAVEETVSTYPGSEGKPRLKFVLEVKDAGRENGDQITEIWHFTNATLSKHQNATFRPFVRALCPELDLDAADLEIDTEDLVGKKCRVILGINEEKGRNSVDKVLPAETRRKEPPKRTAPPPDEEEDAGF